MKQKLVKLERRVYSGYKQLNGIETIYVNPNFVTVMENVTIDDINVNQIHVIADSGYHTKVFQVWASLEELAEKLNK